MKMETMKIAANIKASVLRLDVISQWCENTSWWRQATPSHLHPSPASPDVFSVTALWSALSNGNLARWWQRCSPLFTRRHLQRRRSCATAYSWRPVSQPRPSRRCRYRVVTDRHCRSPTVWDRLRTCPVRCFVVLLYTGHAHRRSLTDWRPCVKFDVAFMHRIVSYGFVSYRFPLNRYHNYDKMF